MMRNEKKRVWMKMTQTVNGRKLILAIFTTLLVMTPRQKGKKEDQHNQKDQDEVHVWRNFRKPTVPLPNFAPKRKEPFASSSWVSARLKICRPLSGFSTLTTQTEKKVRRCECTITRWKTKTSNTLSWSRKNEDKLFWSELTNDVYYIVVQGATSFPESVVSVIVYWNHWNH